MGKGDHYETLLQLALFYHSTPSCLKVMGGVVAHVILVSAQVLLVLTLGLWTQAWQLFEYLRNYFFCSLTTRIPSSVGENVVTKVPLELTSFSSRLLSSSLIVAVTCSGKIWADSSLRSKILPCSLPQRMASYHQTPLQWWMSSSSPCGQPCNRWSNCRHHLIC